jgi:phenylacetic acid degradation operon negative regulatory protein
VPQVPVRLGDREDDHHPGVAHAHLVVAVDPPVAARWRAAGDEDRATGRGQPAIADLQSAAGNEEVDGPAAFSDYLRALDAWRSIPYLDPALPPEYLPHDWPGQRGVALFAELHERLSGPSLSHVLAVTGRHAAAG